MVRCVAAALLGGFLLSASAQVAPSRPFPATALRGQLEIVQPPDVLLNDQPARLAPGARIRGENNLLQMSGALVGQKLTVNYTRDPFGLVLDIWVLTPEERSREPWPRTADEAQRWNFDPAARTWTRR